MASLVVQERLAAAGPRGLLVLHHGRGTNEYDLLPLADALDPARRMHVVNPRAPLPFLDGYRWYETPRVGHPDSATFHASYRAAAELHDELWERTGLSPAETVLGGFSMGTVMSYALGLGADRPAPAGILAFSGFVPTVEAWQPDLTGRTGTRVFIAHGANDPVIGMQFARRAREVLEAHGFPVEYHESDVVHTIDPAVIGPARAWLDATIQ
jgi:phospholipase/carboxylesterase